MGFSKRLKQRILYGAGAAMAVLTLLIGVAPVSTSAHSRQKQSTVFTIENTRITLPDNGGYVDFLGGVLTCSSRHRLTLEGRQSLTQPDGVYATLGSGWRWGQNQPLTGTSFKLLFTKVPGAKKEGFKIPVKLVKERQLLGSVDVSVPGCKAPKNLGSQNRSVAADTCPASATNAVVLIGDKAYAYAGTEATLAAYVMPASATALSGWAERTPQTRFSFASGVAGSCIQIALPNSGKIQVDLLRGTVTPPQTLMDFDMGPMVRSIAYVNRDAGEVDVAVLAPGINI